MVVHEHYYIMTIFFTNDRFREDWLKMEDIQSDSHMCFR